MTISAGTPQIKQRELWPQLKWVHLQELTERGHGDPALGERPSCFGEPPRRILPRPRPYCGSRRTLHLRPERFRCNITPAAYRSASAPWWTNPRTFLHISAIQLLR